VLFEHVQRRLAVDSIAGTSLIYLAVALPMVVGAAWSMHRHSAPPLFDLMDDADELLVSAVHRISTVAHLLLGSGIAVAMTPGSSWNHLKGTPAVLGAWAGLLLWLAAIHIVLLGAFALIRYRQRQWELVDASAPAPAPPPLPLPLPLPMQAPNQAPLYPAPAVLAPPLLACWPHMPPAPQMPIAPDRPVPTFAAAPAPPAPQPFGPLPANPWAPPPR
jgi:hypothetical protein